MTLQAKRIEYKKKDESTGEYIGFIEERFEDRILVKLHEVYDTLKDGTKKQSYRTLMIEKVTVIETITLTVG